MAEQSDNSSKSTQSNIGVYPYDCIRLELKDLLSRFGSRLGIDFVPLVFQRGTKGGGKYAAKWTSRTWEELEAQPGYKEALTSKAWNIGIRLGPGSGKLSSFDIDTENRVVIDTLLKYKPELADTLWTKSPNQKSGANIWFRQKGDWAGWTLGKHAIAVPGILGKKDEACLEFRTQDGLQNIIFGVHTDGGEYYVANDKPVLEFEFNDFKALIAATSALGWTGWPELVKNRTSRAEGRWYNEPLAWKGKFETRCQILESLGYEIRVADETTGKVAITCINEEEHSRDSGEWQTVIFTGTDSTERPPKYYCPHSHCKTVNEETGSSVNRDQTQRIIQAFAEVETIFYRVGNARLNETYSVAYQKMRETEQFYNLNKTLVRWQEGWTEVLPINSARLHPALNELGIAITQQLKSGSVTNKKLAGSDAGDLIDQPTYLDQYLARIRAVLPCSLYYRAKNEPKGLLAAYGYCPEIEYLNLSKEKIDLMPLEQGKEFLDRFLLNFFEFETSTDRSRAIVALLSPATLLGGWYEGRAPAQLVVADKRQAGKTFFLKLLAAIYNHDLILQEYLERSIGGVIERLQHELGRGSPFFAIDNIRGSPDLPFVEIFTTGGREVQFRGAYEKMRYADTTRMTLLMCGNEGFKITGDLASRCVITKLLYKAGRTWRLEDGIALASQVQANWPTYLAAIFGIVRAWALDGCKTVCLSPEEVGGTDLRFIGYTESHNYMLKMLEEKPFTAGLADRQTRVCDTNIVFSEKAFELLETQGHLNKEGSPKAYGEFFRDSELDLPFKYDGLRSLSTRMGLHFQRMPSISEKVNRYGKGYVHITKSITTGQQAYLFSKDKIPPKNPEIFEYQ
jgi:hypothetical protein